MRFIFLFVILFASQVYACPKGFSEYSGDCVEDGNIPKPPFQEYEFYGHIVSKIGQTSDLFAWKNGLLEKPKLNGKKLYSWTPNADIEVTAKIEKALEEFYLVELTIYDGPTSCGNDAKIQKVLRGYIPKLNQQGVPSLWKFDHMTGLC